MVELALMSIYLFRILSSVIPLPIPQAFFYLPIPESSISLSESINPETPEFQTENLQIHSK